MNIFAKNLNFASFIVRNITLGQIALILASVVAALFGAISWLTVGAVVIMGIVTVAIFAVSAKWASAS